MSMSGMGCDPRPQGEYLRRKENIAIAAEVETAGCEMVTDDLTSTHQPPLEKSFSLVNIASNLMRKEIDSAATRKAAEELRKFEAMATEKKKKFEEEMC